ncbi:MAG: hypothetical protein CVT92_02735 [Bacteroidetes bacterium HGW-Bacteroidetes-1]|jgi:hypothetical protein|nr:MAG: hypothetical protein CVT92_02735 [Bacteroidetes bacterium HGW-Bacteroidetes-1]
MNVPTRLITRISPKLNKSELILSIILLDICKEPECKIGKADIYKHPIMTSTIQDHFLVVSKQLVCKKIICDKYHDKAEEKYVLFEEITRDGLVYNIKFNKETFNMLKRGGSTTVDETIFSIFTALSELRLVLWLHTWFFEETERQIETKLLKTYLNKPISTKELNDVYINPILTKFMKMGLLVNVEKIYDKNDNRYITSFLFKTPQKRG